MSESEETRWRLGAKPEEAKERAAELSSEENEKKEELQQTIQAKAEEIGGGEGEGSLVAEPAEEEKPVTKAPKKKQPKGKASLKKRETNTGKNMTEILRQVERQANQLIRIEKAIVSLQKSVDKIDKQSNTIKQLYSVVTQLQRLVRSNKNQKQNKLVKRKEVGKIDNSKKKRSKGRQ
jgi:hypothetical protein